MAGRVEGSFWATCQSDVVSDTYLSLAFLYYIILLLATGLETSNHD